MNQYARMTAYLSPNIFYANIIVPAVLMVMLLYCGFFLSSGNMPDWFIWIYYITPLHYAIEGVFINEFTDYTVNICSLSVSVLIIFSSSQVSCHTSELVPPLSIAQQFNTTQVCLLLSTYF